MSKTREFYLCIPNFYPWNLFFLSPDCHANMSSLPVGDEKLYLGVKRVKRVTHVKFPFSQTHNIFSARVATPTHAGERLRIL